MRRPSLKTRPSGARPAARHRTRVDPAVMMERAQRGAIPGLVRPAVGAEDDVVRLEVPPCRAARRGAAEAVAGEVGVVVELLALLRPGGEGVIEQPEERIR